MKKIIVVDIGGLIISRHTSEILKTYALGSCIAVTMYCTQRSVMGMAHIALPDSMVDPKKAVVCPGYFADTAIPTLLSKVCCREKCQSKSLHVHLIGGASAIWRDDVFQIGVRNLSAIERLLKKYQIPFQKNETGGNVGRTVEADVATGLISVMMHLKQEL